MKEADYTLKKEVLRFPVYSVGTNDEGTREREKEREKVIAVDIYRYDGGKAMKTGRIFGRTDCNGLNSLINYLRRDTVT